MFTRFSNSVTKATGSPSGFIAAFIGVLIWGLCGPVFKFSNAWQMVINTGTTIITFLMVFIIQHSQNKDTKAMHLKIDELIRASNARNELMGIEKKEAKEIDEICNS